MKIRLLKTPTETVKGTGNKQYTEMLVEYRNLITDKLAAKKVMSFTFPDTFNALRGAAPDSEWTINDVKNNETGYWDWVGAAAGVDSSVPEAAAASSPAKPAPKKDSARPDREWETALERARRQVLIVRQSSLSNAITTLGQGAKREDIITLADFYYDWAFRIKEDSIVAYMSAKDDIPF